MKNTNAVRTEIHYAQVGEYQLPLLTLPQTDDADDDDPLEVIIPPVGPAFLAGVLALFAGLEVFGVNIAFVTVACHEAVPSKF